MPLFKVSFSAAMFATGALLAPLASAQVDTIDKVETTNKDAPRSRPTAHGPITAIRPAALWIATLDTNQDYQVTRPEYEAGLQATFERLVMALGIPSAPVVSACASMT